jgi:hypothetical protein
MAAKWGQCCIGVWLHNVARTSNCVQVSEFKSIVHSNTWLTQFYRCGKAYLWTFEHTICIKYGMKKIKKLLINNLALLNSWVIQRYTFKKNIVYKLYFLLNFYFLQAALHHERWITVCLNLKSEFLPMLENASYNIPIINRGGDKKYIQIYSQADLQETGLEDARTGSSGRLL